jgi:hypothetical protein
LFQSLDGFGVQPGTLELVAAGCNKLINPAQVIQQLNEPGAPQFGGAKRNQPICVRRDSKPPVCTRRSSV